MLILHQTWNHFLLGCLEAIICLLTKGKVKVVDCKKLYFTGQTLYWTMIFFHFLVYLQFGNYWMNFQQKKVSAKNSRIVMERGESFLLEYFFFVFSFYAVYYTRAASLTFYQFLQRKKVHMIWHTYTWVHKFCYSFSKHLGSASVLLFLLCGNHSDVYLL